MMVFTLRLVISLDQKQFRLFAPVRIVRERDSERDNEAHIKVEAPITMVISSNKYCDGLIIPDFFFF